ncbi:MAG: ATP-binding protein [Oscillospiraceae bacterium]|nr:ATP-binding protein [Oscillospiraceae bacterium]
MRKLPLGIQNFRQIVEEDCVYIDKTEHIYNLIERGKCYFLSRPRRFGKSLLLDTIGEVFSGDRELFKGLWIYESDYDFAKHPVIRLDMSNIATETADVFKKSLSTALGRICRSEGVSVIDESPSDMFKHLIEELHNKHKQRVVVLIDEYDKPILDHIDNFSTADDNRSVLRGFYGILKSMDPYLKFTMFTGVSKFTRTSIFSGLNNLTDITMVEDYADICGIPTDSLEEHFGEHIEQLKTLDRFKRFESISEEILTWYDGYSWNGETKLLNPYGLLNFFFAKAFKSFWYSTGTPNFLVEMLKNKPESYLELSNYRITEAMMENFDIDSMVAEPLLFQTGYLTVKEVLYTMDSPVYVVDIPNYEVRNAFNRQLLAAFTENDEVRTDNMQIRVKEALEEGSLDAVLEILRGFFASIPYELHVKAEAYYHSIFYAFMTIIGFEILVEVSTSRGRVDAVLERGDKVYIMEFKYEDCSIDASLEKKREVFNKALSDAMNQINEKGYADRYQGSGKSVIKVAFAFLGRDEIEMLVV